MHRQQQRRTRTSSAFVTTTRSQIYSEKYTLIIFIHFRTDSMKPILSKEYI